MRYIFCVCPFWNYFTTKKKENRWHIILYTLIHIAQTHSYLSYIYRFSCKGKFSLALNLYVCIYSCAVKLWFMNNADRMTVWYTRRKEWFNEQLCSILTDNTLSTFLITKKRTLSLKRRRKTKKETLQSGGKIRQ